MSKHTPGPWKVKIWDYSQATPPRKELNVLTETNLLATVAWDEGMDNPFTIQDSKAKANAALIASAPDLLKALKYAKAAIMEAVMLSAMRNGTEYSFKSTIERINAALTKATDERSN